MSARTIPIVRAANVQRRYGGVLALSDVSFELTRGVTGLLGANGAGKTTLINLMLGILRPHAGRLEVLGMDPLRAGHRLRQRIGYAPEDERFPPDVKANELVRHFAEMRGIPRRAAVLRASEGVLAGGRGGVPATGYGACTTDPVQWRTNLFRPAATLALASTSALTRQLRASMADVMARDYIRTAEAKGLPWALIMAKHAFKNALIPVLTLAGITFVIMINAAVVIEVIFAWPGIGRLLFEGISQRDFPLVQGVVLMAGVIIVLTNLTVDILYAWIDPRIRVAR